MARRVFYSFHFQADHWRAGQVRNMGVIEGNPPVSDNDWEAVKRGGDAAIERWIADQMQGRSCAVVLIGAQTAGRKWISHEIVKAWNDGKGIVAVYVHNLLDQSRARSPRGSDPFAGITVGGVPMSSIVRSYDPPDTPLKSAYLHISENLAAWVEEAVLIRSRH